MNLRQIVAGLAGCPAEEIGPDFSLERPGLQGSMRRALLVASIRRHLGKDILKAAVAKTFSELETLVSGRPADRGGPKDPSTGARAAASQRPAPPPPLPTISSPDGRSCGVDLEPVSRFPETASFQDHEFYKENFTPSEISYCAAQASPRMHLAARWCAKEALRKCDARFLRTGFADIEVSRREDGSVQLLAKENSSWQKLPHALSISHTEDWAVAVVVSSI